MDLEQLKREWVKPERESADRQAKIWDGRAEEYGKKEIPRREESPFLKYLWEKAKPDKEMTVLDIGCGAGLYTIALAGQVKEAVGVDVSPGMIGAAGDSARMRELANVRFYAGDWSAWDPERAGFQEKFNLVFAHMTPAICDYATMERMNACAKEHCFLVKPARRRDMVQDAAFAQVGITGQGKQFDDAVSNVFTYLWQKGYDPEVSYRKERWEREMAVDQMTDWCVNRAKLQRVLTGAQEEEIARYLQEKSKDGKVKETTETTIVTIYWHV